MFRKGKAVAKSDPDGEEERERSVILLSSSDEDEANGDLSLDLVNRAREREVKRKSEDDRAELEKREASRLLINLSSSSSDEIEVVEHERSGDRQPCMVPRKRKKSRRKKKKKVEDKENDINVVKLDEPLSIVEAVGSKSAEVFNSVVECRERLAASEVSNSETISSEVARESANSGKAEESSSPVETVGPGVGDMANDIKAEAASPVVDIAEAGVGALDNSVLRKLLRGPRYFDPPENHSDTCYNCGKEGHTAAVCTSEKRKKPCFVCGNHGHSAKHCTQGQDCFICKRRGHVAKNCPEKGQVGFQNSKFCLHCGDFGHDMSTCKNDYTPEDLKDIQCYICRKYGHLCCADIIDADPVEASCYNCGQSGHSGSGCAKLRGETSGTASLNCFKCGEEGHFARGCTKSAKSAWTSGETSTSAKKLRKDEQKGSKSVPPEVEKAHKKKKKPHEDRKSISAGKKPKWRDAWAKNDPGDLPNRSPRKRRERGGWIPDDIGDFPRTLSPKKPKRRGGWIPEDPVDTPYGRRKKGNSWDSPAPARWSDNTCTPTPVTHGWHPRSFSPFERQNMQSGSPGSQTWTRPSSNGLAASRFGSNARKTYWRG